MQNGHLPDPVRSFIILWCAVRHLLSSVQNGHFQCSEGVGTAEKLRVFSSMKIMNVKLPCFALGPSHLPFCPWGCTPNPMTPLLVSWLRRLTQLYEKFASSSVSSPFLATHRKKIQLSK